MKKFLITFFALIIVSLVTIYTYLDFIAEKAIEKYGLKALGVPVTVGKISVKLLEGKFVFKNVKIKNPEGFKYNNAIEIGSVSAQLDIKDVFKDVITINTINIENPNIFYELGVDGNNIQALKNNTASQRNTAAAEDKAVAKKGGQKNKKVVISKLFINKAKVNFVLDKIAEKTLTLPDIYIQNIGKDANGITVESASDQVLRELTKAISKANVQTMINDLLNLPQNIDGIKSHVEDKINEFTGEINKFLSK